MEAEVPNTYSYLFGAYSVVWVLLAGYIISLVVRVGRLERKYSSKEEAENNGAD